MGAADSRVRRRGRRSRPARSRRAAGVPRPRPRPCACPGRRDRSPASCRTGCRRGCAPPRDARDAPGQLPRLQCRERAPVNSPRARPTRLGEPGPGRAPPRNEESQGPVHAKIAADWAEPNAPPEMSLSEEASRHEAEDEGPRHGAAALPQPPRISSPWCKRASRSLGSSESPQGRSRITATTGDSQRSRIGETIPPVCPEMLMTAMSEPDGP